MKMKNIIIIAIIVFLTQIGITSDKTEVFVIISSGKKPYKECLDGFKRATSGKNIELLATYNLAGSNSDEIMSEISNKNPAMILALGTKAYDLTKKVSVNIPVVYSMLIDENIANRKNSTGSSMRVPLKMKVDKLTKIVPGIETIGTIYSSKEALENQKLGEACKALGYNYESEEISSITEFPKAVMDLSSVIDCFILIPDPTVISAQSIKKLLTITAKRKVPVVGLSTHYTMSGALVSYNSDYRDLGRQAGELAIKIVAGESVVNLKSTNPEKINVSFNLLVANILDIVIPQEEIANAEAVFQ